ncbi:Histidine kinase-, DNA gyrase B-, and HSP90-like ATPase [Bacteroidales bacterium WCE2004]|nr:Histidine kinase-, DNA gyrase B-, and HSP90-like ATPase [Bacteroidales bacterium WCE2004]
MNIIEEALFKKTENFQEGQIYSEQWKFAKSYLPQMLDTISHIFPHYSLHNSTHSDAILNNIVRIIGPDSVKKLSVVDLWLLLAAAYYHDCGMVVTGEDKHKLFEDGSKFIKFVKDIQQDKFSPLHQYANLFEVRAEKLFYKNEQLTSESYECARFLLAAFIRDKHSERSGKRIEKEDSLHFPGNPIPERIIRILRSICDCHAKDVEEVMKLQPVESSGCGVEDCHPRFVAAMLRLGDLLDIDSNRVSEVLLSTLGCIPSDSKFYNETNRAITHIRVDQSIIEITAECNDYHVADLVNRWFQWLNDELVFYMKRWHKIIPFEGFGYLPTVGELKVNLVNYDTFDGKKRPSFEIDSNKAVELLQGAGLYLDSCECIRELLQNAVDATYLRVYKENPGISDLKKFKSECNKYAICVKLDKIKNTNAKENEIIWKIEISDKGIGMTKDDLAYLSKTGSSGENKEKKRLIQSVPCSLWPSGTFGIGFQSVFLLTDKVCVVTRKINKDEYVKAELHNPSGKEKGAILIQSIRKEDVGYGTTISFEFNERIDERLHYERVDNTDYNSVSAFISFDFAKSKSLSIMGVKVIDELIRFSNGSFVPIEIIFSGGKKKILSQNKIPFDDLNEETGLQVCIDKLSFQPRYENRSMVFFRNQKVRQCFLAFPFVSFNINILKGTAKEALTLNRDSIRAEYWPSLYKDIKLTVIKYVIKKYDSLDVKDKQLASMFLFMFRQYIIENNISDLQGKDSWRSYIIPVKKRGQEKSERCSLGELLSADSIEYIDPDYQKSYFKFIIADAEYRLEESYDYLRSRLIKTIARDEGYYYMIKHNGYLLSKKPCDVIEDSDETRETLIRKYLDRDRWARGLFPCSEKYAALRINRQEFSKYTKAIDEFDLNNYPCMICPYVRVYDLDRSDEAIRLEYNCDSKVIKTVYDNRIDKAVTKKQIEQAYNLFRKEWDPIIERINKSNKPRKKTNLGSFELVY